MFADELKRLHGEATEAPWNYYDDSNDGKVNRIEIVAIGKTIAHIYRSVPREDVPNAALIALLRNKAEAIIALVEAAQKVVDNVALICDEEIELEAALSRLNAEDA